jgi:phosphoribosyl 1,2-cyclic phosphodiesterase
VKVTIWGARGSIPAPGPETTRYGGNTSCVQVTLDDGSTFVLDAGTGIRSLGLALDGAAEQPLHILLTHLHLDHIQGLMFFAPMFNPRSEVVVWGPASPEASLEDRIARYISAPLSPVEVRELPCHPSFREAETTEWRIGSATIRAASVTHRGPTLGYRIEADGASLCYIPDHEPGLGAPLASLEEEWISGFDLARGASLLIHDCQYTDEEYPHHIGWGHSPLSDTLAFADRTNTERLLLFHHDPLHSDAFLDGLADGVADRLTGMSRHTDWACFATERQELVPPHAASAEPAAS